MSSNVSPENEQFIQQIIQSGVYQDRGAVLDDALDLLKRREQLRRKVDAGIEQLDRGEGIAGEQVFARLEESGGFTYRRKDL